MNNLNLLKHLLHYQCRDINRKEECSLKIIVHKNTTFLAKRRDFQCHLFVKNNKPDNTR